MDQKQIDEFLKAELSDWLEYAEAVFKKSLIKKGLVDTQELLNSIHAEMTKPIENNQGVATMLFVDYGRIVDILGYRKTALSAKVGTKGVGVRTKRGVKVKNKKWYSRTKQGVILNLVERLVTSEAEIVAKEIARSIEQQKSP